MRRRPLDFVSKNSAFRKYFRENSRKAENIKTFNQLKRGCPTLQGKGMKKYDYLQAVTNDVLGYIEVTTNICEDI